MKLYSPEVFQSIPDGNETNGLTEKHKDEMELLGSVICDHKIEDILGITLIHRHHDLSAEERIVWNVIGNEWIARPIRTSDDQLCPVNWKVGLNEDLYPLEFCPNTEDYKNEVEKALRVMSSKKFLDDFVAQITKCGLWDIFGLGLLETREAFISPGMTIYERTSKKDRTTKAYLVPESEVAETENYGGITLWKFTPNGGSGTRKCWYGGSKHCCGL